jgi:hypothetical protein
LVKSFGERLPSCTAESFHRKARAQIPEALKPALEPLFSVLERLDEQIAAYDDQVEQLAKKYPDVEAIAQARRADAPAVGHWRGVPAIRAQGNDTSGSLSDSPKRRRANNDCFEELISLPGRARSPALRCSQFPHLFPHPSCANV